MNDNDVPAHPGDPQPTPAPAQPMAPAGGPVPSAAGDAVILSFDIGEPTDDTPTIISKNMPRASGADEALAGSLRGQRLAHFELIEPIGVGGMAAVLRARDTQLDRFVALKILPPDMAQDAENVSRFHQEARAAARLDHENIARVFFCGEDRRLHFIAFEFVEGDNLRTVLERRGRLPVGEALHYVLQIAAGLAHAAARGVVHRDIKPSNIIITPGGRAKLVDMGLARSLDTRSDRGLTHSGVTLGTFDYISPEQALEPRDADVRSDIYSLGCTFYHMLTGHPPVPEGTAAKKLHHHQHIKPSDPRQVVPGLPDEVAVVLDRMMAKQPRDRYQSPEELVHHLLMAARKLGTTLDVPEGVLSVEAALPNQPAGRPLLLATLAAVAVVALIYFLGQPGGDTSPGTPRPRPGNRATTDNSDPKAQAKPSTQEEKAPVDRRSPQEKSPGSVPPLTVKPAVARYADSDPSADSLRAWLLDHRDAEEIELLLGAKALDLSNRDGTEGLQGLVIRCPKVTIRPFTSGQRATILFTYDGMVETGRVVRAPLTIESRTCLIEGVRFEINAAEGTTPIAGLVLRGGQQTVRDCEFIQREPSLRPESRFSSVLVEGPARASGLLLDHCVFLGLLQRPAMAEESTTQPPGTDNGRLLAARHAVARRGGVPVEARQCAFGPHAAVFQSDGADDATSGIRLVHCSVLMQGASAIFELAKDTQARISVQQSLFSRPGDAGMTGMTGQRAVLLHLGPGSRLIAFSGSENRYHNLDSYWSEDGAGMAAGDGDWNYFQDRLRDRTEKDESRELAPSPWMESSPLAQLLAGNTAAAFQINPTLADVRLPTTGTQVVHVAGAEQVLGTDYLAALKPLGPTPVVPARRTLVIKPNKTDADTGVYRSLDHALPDIKPGDLLLLHHDGELKISPVVLARKELQDVTLRPDKDCKPILTLLETAGVDRDAAMFRVHAGRLTLEDLEIRLRPGREEFEAQVLVALAGDGECVLRNCVLTLDRNGRAAKLALGTLLEAPRNKMMDLEAPPPRSPAEGPRLALERCFVRGEGDLLWARTSRPCELALRDSLLMLTGSLCNVEAARDQQADAGTMLVKLDHVTSCLAGQLLRLRGGKDLKGISPLRFEPSASVFVPAATGDRVLVHLEGHESDEAALVSRLSWAPNRNAYGNFNALLEYQAPEEGKMPQPWTATRWKDFTSESTSAYGIGLAALPAVSFAQVLPADGKPGDGVPDRTGADVNALPRPSR